MAVQLTVDSQLKKIIGELEQIAERSKNVGDSLKEAASKTSEHMNDEVRKTQGFFSELRDMGRRVSDGLKQDFKALLSINAISGSMKLSEQFRGSIKEAITLSDTVRRLGSTFGIASGDWSRFQEKMIRGLGQIGLSSEAASNALGGLSETPVRGEGNLLAYTKTAGQLASIGGERGKEGDIAKGLAGAVVARGGNPNDLSQLKSVQTEVLQIRQATGKTATEALAAINDLFSSMNEDFKGRFRKGGGTASLGAAALIGGKGATGFLEQYLGMDRIERMGLEAQGFGKIIGPNGQLNNSAIQKTLAEAKARGLGDAQAGLKTFGLTDPESAKGFIRLAEALKTQGDVIEKARTSVVDINRQYEVTMGLADSFAASINRIKGVLAKPLSYGTSLGTNLLQKASHSDLGAAGVVAGGGVLAAILAGAGMRGVGKGLGLGGLAKGAAVEGLTGRQVQPVYVVNAGEIGGGVGGGGGKLGKVLGGAAILGTEYGLLQAGKEFVEKNTVGTNAEGFKGDALDRFLFRLDALMSGHLTGISDAMKNYKVTVDLNKRDLKATRTPSRGVSIGP